MPRTELPSGGWIEWTDKVMSGTRFEVRKAIRNEITSAPDGTVVQQLDGANEDRQRVALWFEVITGWSFAETGIPIPKANLAGADVVWQVLDMDDYNALADATQDLLEKVVATPTQRKTAAGSSTT